MIKKADLEAAEAAIRAAVADEFGDLRKMLDGEPPPEPPPDPGPPIRILPRDAQDITQWSETSAVSSVRVAPQLICVNHSNAGKWPVLDDGVAIEGNVWVVAEIDGDWWAGTYEWLRPGQTCKALGSGGKVGDRLGGHLKLSPMDSWRPKAGERVGFFVSTFARDNRRTANERSNIKWVDWPEGA